MRAIAATALSVASLLGACGGDGDTVAPTTTLDSTEKTTTTGAATTTTLSPEDEVLAAYKAAKEALSPAFDPPDPQNPGLLATYTGEALARVQASIQQLRDQGLGARNTFESRPRDLVVTGDTATLSDCFIDRSEIYTLADGQVQGPPEETIRLVEVTMQRVDGTWRLAKSQRMDEACTPT